MFACTSDSVETVVHLLDAMEKELSVQSEIDYRDHAGRTALHWALSNGTLRMVELLLSRGANPKLVTKQGALSTTLAMHNNRVAFSNLLTTLAKAGCTASMANSEGVTSLMVAVEKRSIEAVRTLLEYRASSTQESNVGTTPLLIAVEANDLAMLQLLIEHGADLDHENVNGVTPLMVATQLNLEDMVRALCKHGVDINHQGRTGNTAVLCAVEQDLPEMLQLLLLLGASMEHTDGMQQTVATRAAKAGSVKILQVLADAHDNFNFCPSNGVTPLLAAVRSGKSEAVKFLLKEGADPTATDNGHENALLAAVTEGKLACIAELVEFGVDITDGGVVGRTPLEYACFSNRHDSMKKLIDLGADVRAISKDGGCALHTAVEHSDVDTLLILASKVETKDWNSVRPIDGRTPLMVAAALGKIRSILTLQTFGVDFNYETANGETALMCACGVGNQNSIRTLVNCGANVNYMSRDGKTAAMYASAEGQLECIGLLGELGCNIDLESHHGRHAIFEAVSTQQTASVEALLAVSKRHNFETGTGDTSLLTAIGNNLPGMVEFLTGLGEDLRYENRCGITPLIFACMKGHLPCVRMILGLLSQQLETEEAAGNKTDVSNAGDEGRTNAARARKKKKKKPHHTTAGSTSTSSLLHPLSQCRDEINRTNKYGLSAFHVAVMLARVEVSEFLLENGGDPGSENKAGHNLFTMLCCDPNTIPGLSEMQVGSSEVAYFKGLKWLVTKSTPLSGATKGGMLPLHTAAKHDKDDVLDLLLDQGLDVNEENPSGTIALCEAAERGSMRTLQRLISRGGLGPKTAAHRCTAMCLAIRNSHCAAVQALIDAGVSTDASEPKSSLRPLDVCLAQGSLATFDIVYGDWAAKGHLPTIGDLCVAIAFGRHDIVTSLLRSELDINEANAYGRTPLMEAAAAGHVDLLQLLVDSGADPSQTSTILKCSSVTSFFPASAGFTPGLPLPEELVGSEVSPLILAATCHQLRTVDELVNVGANINQTVAGKSVLGWVCEMNMAEEAKHLLARGADPNFEFHTGNTPLLSACRCATASLLSALEDHGADFYTYTATRMNPILAAAEGDNQEAMDFVLKTLPGEALNSMLEEALLCACSNGSSKLVEKLVAGGASVNAEYVTGMTPLSTAVCNGRLEVIQTLAAHHFALVDLPNRDGMTPLMFAARFGLLEVMAELVRLNATVSLQVREHTALNEAIKSKQIGALKFLLKNGASPSTESSSRITPMVLAAQCDFHQALSILVGGGAPIDQCNASGETALKAAATSGAIASIKQLVALGAVVDNEVEGVTPLQAAISAQNMASVEALCALGAD
eukprot:scaffold766_cov560-Prasinococcus_capsulatus_cf.AAC.9